MFSLFSIFSLNFYWFYKVFILIIGVTIEEVNIISPPEENIQYHILGRYMKIMIAFLLMTYIFCVYVCQVSGMNTKLTLRSGVDILINFL